jgi:hypothetical protein
MPTADDFYKWMKEFHPGIYLVGFQKRFIETYFNKEVAMTTSNPRLMGKKFLRKKITEFEEYWSTR